MTHCWGCVRHLMRTLSSEQSVIKKKALLHFSGSSMAESVINYYCDRSKLGCTGTSQTQQSGKGNVCDVRNTINNSMVDGSWKFPHKNSNMKKIWTKSEEGMKQEERIWGGWGNAVWVKNVCRWCCTVGQRSGMLCYPSLPELSQPVSKNRGEKKKKGRGCVLHVSVCMIRRQRQQGGFIFTALQEHQCLRQNMETGQTPLLYNSLRVCVNSF